MPADGPEAPRDATTPRILRIEVDLTEAPEMAFARRVQGFADGSRRSRIRVPARPAEPAVVDGTPVGRVLTVRAPKELTLELRPAKGWGSERPVRLRWTGSPHGGGSRVVAEIEGWEELLSSDGHGNLLDWASESFFPHLLDPFGAQSLGDWAADRAARRPTGAAARENYRDPPYHGPNFHLILDRLGLTPSDRLLEVACGGGAFLHRALESGGTASAIDHSPEMLRVAGDLNSDAMSARRLTLVEGDAGALPFDTGTFTCCVCTGAFGFFPEPARTLREMRRVLAPGGRLALFTDSPAPRGTPAAPEPIASRSRSYEPGELEPMARPAGFSEVRVEEPERFSYAERARLPPDVLDLFRGTGGALLPWART